MKIKLQEHLASRDGYLWLARDLPGRRKTCYLVLLSIGSCEVLQLSEFFFYLAHVSIFVKIKKKKMGVKRCPAVLCEEC